MIKKFIRFLRRLNKIPEDIAKIQESLGRIEGRQLNKTDDIHSSGFRVFSQWDEDGIIQHLVNRIDIKNKVFIEFGVENYDESNTRFLLTNNNWSGLVLDGNKKYIHYIKNDSIYWASNLKAENIFINKNNINKIIQDNGISGEIGILSVDIDGVDYWILEAINCISPSIIICEYNNIFGENAEVSVPYDAHFTRESAHFSKLYYGASLSALFKLLQGRGYELVASNKAKNNAFFVRNDLMSNLKALSPNDVYEKSPFRESHDEDGNLTYDDFNRRLRSISHLPVYNFKNNKIQNISDIQEFIEEL